MINIYDFVGFRIIFEFVDDMERVVCFINESFWKEEELVIFVCDCEVGWFWKIWFGVYEICNYCVSLEKVKCGVFF